MPRPTPPQTHRVEPKTGCWIWQGAKNNLGYGRLAGRKRYAHRLYYEKFKGPIPAGMEIDHLCRNPQCVNPEHLEAVAHWVNIRRGKLGKLTPEEVLECRVRYANGKMLVKELAAEYRISESQMSRILGPVRKGHITKLTVEEVLTIRRLYATGKYSTRQLGERFGVASNTVSCLVRGKYRKEVR